MNKTPQQQTVKRSAPQKRFRKPRNNMGEYLMVFVFGYVSSLIVPIRVVTSEVYCPNQSCSESQHIILRGGNDD